jgi:hypothetical protein
LLLIRNKSVLLNKEIYSQAQNRTLNRYNDTERDSSIITLIDKQKNSNSLILLKTQTSRDRLFLATDNKKKRGINFSIEPHKTIYS